MRVSNRITPPSECCGMSADRRCKHVTHLVESCLGVVLDFETTALQTYLQVLSFHVEYETHNLLPTQVQNP